MSLKENDKYLEELQERKEEMEDCEKQVKQAEKDLKDAEEWLIKRKIYYSESVIEYYKFKEKQNEI